ncbi:MAG TPA: carbohydrate ABC transporter permease [Armatimonadota bacterium]|jgi:ABC-type glycerol-3-phosphate transport system permease component
MTAVEKAAGAAPMKSRRSADRIRLVVTHLSLMALAVVFVAPFYWMVSTSLKQDRQIFDPASWYPNPVMWANYKHALTYIPFLRYTENTLLICAVSMFGTVLSCSLVAYSFGRIQWKGRDALFVLVLATLMLPGQVTMIPVFLIFKWLGWIGSYKPLLVPTFFGSAFYVFLLRQFFRSIPAELSESARMDGATEGGIYARIIMPLSKPALATVALFTFIGAWTDFMGPLLFINDPNKYTLSLGLQQFVSQHGAEWSMLMAASTVMALPIIVLYFLAQRTFVEGITLTGIKG